MCPDFSNVSFYTFYKSHSLITSINYKSLFAETKMPIDYQVLYIHFGAGKIKSQEKKGKRKRKDSEQKLK